MEAYQKEGLLNGSLIGTVNLMNNPEKCLFVCIDFPPKIVNKSNSKLAAISHAFSCYSDLLSLSRFPST